MRRSVALEGRTVGVAGWQFDVVGQGGFIVPAILLDTDLPDNSEGDRTITHYLHGGDARYRLLQESVLGIGGVRMLRALGYGGLQRHHMNEGHASLLVLELLREEAQARQPPVTDEAVIDSVHRKCVFTTHTPVAAGHDTFPLDLARRVLDPTLFEAYQSEEGHRVVCCDDQFNMTFLGFNLSHYINGVAKRHGQDSQQMFGQYPIDAITNGVHASTWVSPPLADVFDKHIPGWREDTFSLRYAMSINREELWNAHRLAKRRLIEEINRDTNRGFDIDVLTVGFARRATAYKRPDLILSNLDRLKHIAMSVGPIQLTFAGKAHPHDEAGKDLIRSVFRAIGALRPQVRAAYLPNYDMELCRLMVAGVDVWLNTPQPPWEASGTSGIKAALNGVPSRSLLDGWWLEGCIEGVTAWAVGSDTLARDASARSSNAPPADTRTRDANALYEKLQNVIVPLFYEDWNHFADVMRHAIAINGSFFNARRMVQNYVTMAYFE
jgi:starch phosphorylase